MGRWVALFLALAAVSASMGDPAHATAAAHARAARPSIGVSDGRIFGNADPVVRAAGLAVARRVGARFVRVPVIWSLVVRSQGFTRPTEAVPLTDPANPTYRWDRIDAALSDIAAAGLTPMVYFLSAPPWAESAPRYGSAAAGTWAPRPTDLAAFASAVARRYDGTYPDPQRPGQSLPRVAYFQTWNEPNLSHYLQPQWVPSGGAWVAFAARWYARMHAAAYAAIHARQPDARVGLAGLAPTGTASAGAARTAPMRFLRALLCVGDGARADCGPPLRFDAVALHPLSTSDPDLPAPAADDISVADLQPKLTAVLDRARRSGRLAPGARPALWVTELNWTSAEVGGVLVAQEARVIGRALMRLQQAGASIVNWQFVTDSPSDRTGGEARPAGLTIQAAGDPRSLPGKPKSFLRGFAFPAAAVAVGDARAYVWGWLPSGPDAHSAAIELRANGRWRRLTTVRAAADGTVSGLIASRLGAILRLRAGDRVSEPVRVQSRLGRVLSRSPIVTHKAPRAARASYTPRAPGAAGTSGVDPRPPDSDGPGAFGTQPPAALGYGPPPAVGPPLPILALPAIPQPILTFRATGTGDVVLGTSSADLLRGSSGNDLLIGLGGDDRFVPGLGRDLRGPNEKRSVLWSAPRTHAERRVIFNEAELHLRSSATHPAHDAPPTAHPTSFRSDL